MIDSPYLVKPGKGIKLRRLSTKNPKKYDKDDTEIVTTKNLDKLRELQEILYAQAKHAVLIVLQAMDAGGKDSTSRSIFSGVNPQGCNVSSFKVPSEEELSHDYLWRIHHRCPRKGMIVIFNRSHYESVLVERVKNLVPKKVWSKRYDHINDFEQMLADEGTTIIKFFLNISQKEQGERMQSRLDDPTKRWKFNPADLVERRSWDQYMKAFQDALSKCSTRHAPWYVVPADNKWYRNLVVSEIIVRTLAKLDLKYPDPRTE
jgi:PPK2 family polyphosphate:nucleotide phosphotransferase